jgi:hypothetical protein
MLRNGAEGPKLKQRHDEHIFRELRFVLAAICRPRKRLSVAGGPLSTSAYNELYRTIPHGGACDASESNLKKAAKVGYKRATPIRLAPEEAAEKALARTLKIAVWNSTR